MVWLVVMLVTGEIVTSVAPLPMTECHKVQAAVSEGRRVMAEIEGERGEQVVVRAECRVASDDPVS